MRKFLVFTAIFAFTFFVFFVNQTHSVFAAATSICGQACKTDADCKPGSGGNWKTVCGANKICVNPNCPTDTTPGTICGCNTPTQNCGDKCGYWSGLGLLPLCKSGSGCLSATGPSCSLNNTYCSPNAPQNGYTRQTCATDTTLNYLADPNGAPITTLAQLQSACGISTTPAIGPACMGVTMSKQSPTVGDTVTFSCGQVSSANHYEFRVKQPDGTIQTVVATAAGNNVSQNFTVSQQGSFSVQCRVCSGSDASTCQPFESW